MSGVDLFDAYTRAGKSLPACCVKTLNAATDVHPSARELLKVGAEAGKLVAKLHCKACGRNWVIRADRGNVSVEAANK